MTTNVLTPEPAHETPGVLTPELLHKMDAYWRAANYWSVGRIYLYDNPRLKEPLKLSHVKPLVGGHWGTTPGQNFIYAHLNRVIKKYDLDMLYIAGPPPDLSPDQPQPARPRLQGRPSRRPST
jgi:phosphoketolase